MNTKKQWFIFCQDELLLQKINGEFCVPFQEEPPVATAVWTTIIEPADGYATLSISSPVLENENFVMLGLRKTYDVLNEHDYLIAGKCREMLYWDLSNKYCGCCGGPMRFNSPISKKCTMCGKELWPNVAVATIVLIRKDDKILMVHAHNFRNAKTFGLVAGFVETGETLEECVMREAQEETGIKIKNLKYFGSQPWPYPCGLMVGYYADYEEGEIHLQRSELSNGGWFDKEHLPDLPQKLSIARKLIDAWIENRLEEGMK